MNAPFPSPTSIERHKFTIDDVRRMSAQGLVPKRAVLLDGEVYHMPEDGDRHIGFTMRLARRIMSALDESRYFVGVQTTLRMSTHNAPSPDIGAPAGRMFVFCS
jgi:hypothetical protein